MDDLFFNRINTKEYRARVAAHDGKGWHHGVYIVRSTPAMQQKDPYHAWQAESPEGLVIAEQVSLIDAMKACNFDVPSYVQKAEADSTAVITDPMLILEVL